MRYHHKMFSEILFILYFSWISNVHLISWEKSFGKFLHYVLELILNSRKQFFTSTINLGEIKMIKKIRCRKCCRLRNLFRLLLDLVYFPRIFRSDDQVQFVRRDYDQNQTQKSLPPLSLSLRSRSWHDHRNNSAQKSIKTSKSIRVFVKKVNSLRTNKDDQKTHSDKERKEDC